MGRWDNYLIRCSSLGDIMTAGRGAKITDKQLEELNDLLSRVKLTEKQADRRDELISKRDAKPELSATAKSMLRKIWKEETYGVKKEITSKYTEKGNQVEKDAIQFASKVLNWGILEDFDTSDKNRINNEFITGEPDVNWDPKNLLADVKSSWDVFTFPDLATESPNDDYFWQGVGYMALTNKSEFYLVYCLMDTPEHLVLDEIRKAEYARNVICLTDEEEIAIRKRMTFSHMPDWARIRVFKFTRQAELEQQVYEQVIECRNYLNALDTIWEKNMESINQFKIK